MIAFADSEDEDLLIAAAYPGGKSQLSMWSPLLGAGLLLLFVVFASITSLVMIIRP